MAIYADDFQPEIIYESSNEYCFDEYNEEESGDE